MKTKYKSGLFPNNFIALRIAESELNKPDQFEINEKRHKTYNEKIKNDLSIGFSMIHTKNNNEQIIKYLNYILTYAKDNYFYDPIRYDDIELIFNFSFGIFYDKPKIEAPEMEEEEEELIDAEKVRSQQKDISEIAGELLPLLLKQPDIADIFITNGGLNNIFESLNMNLKCIFISLASIAKISKYNRDEVFGFGFYEILLGKITCRPIPIIDFEAACKMAESLVEFEMSYPEQNQCAKEIFFNLYDLEDDYFMPDFLDAARKLLHHIIWSDEYGEEYQIFNIFPLLPVEDYQLNQQITIGQCNDKPLFPFIKRKIDVNHLNDKNEQWFEKSANYLYNWIYYIFFENNDQEFIQEVIRSYDFNHIWHILLTILENNFFRKAYQIAASALSLLVQIDIDNFIDKQYYAAIVDQFPTSTVKIKAKLLAVIAIFFTKATNEQMLELVNQPNIFELIFDTIYSIDLTNKYIYDIICGLYHFIDFCGLSQEGMEAFRNLVVENDDFKEWVEQLIEYSSQLPNEGEYQNLIDQINRFNTLIHQRLNEYNAALQNMRSPDNF